MSLSVCSSLLSSVFFQEGPVLVDLVSVILKEQQQQNDELAKKQKSKIYRAAQGLLVWQSSAMVCAVWHPVLNVTFKII